jgi:hypothetical protein
MWRPIAAILVALTALYNIYMYSDILQITVYSYIFQDGSHLVLSVKTSSLARITTTLTEMPHAKFYMIPTLELTTDLLESPEQQQTASLYYERALNEESAEVWLHRGFQRMSTFEQTKNPDEADVFLIAGYLHFAKWNKTKTRDYVTTILLPRIHDKKMPHVVLCPTWNPTTSQTSGIAPLIALLEQEGVNTWSVGFERNPLWQVVNASRIIPIPYVVRPTLSREEILDAIRTTPRIDNFVFYAGDQRPHAVEWAGCNRSMVLPLQAETNTHVSIRHKRNRLSQDDYNRYMWTSDYCLILCGDTVTSRSLTSAMIHACIPIRIGSRLRGLCEPPCHNGWGWSIAGPDYPHLPFPSTINWDEFPEVHELEFSKAPLETLQTMFERFTPQIKTRIRESMLQHQLGWIYGWGDPITSNDFGQAINYVWQSIVTTLGASEATF